MSRFEQISSLQCQTLSPSIAQLFLNAFKQVSQSQSPCTFEYPLATIGGTRHFEAHVAPHGADCLISLVRDVTERVERESQLAKLAFHDPLTGLANRRLMHDRLDQALASARRNMTHCLVMLLDLDGFKAVNDTHGHAVGDQLLTQVANRLKHSVRASDTVARIGGDEFVLVLTDIHECAVQSLELAHVSARKLHEALAPTFLLESPLCSSPPVSLAHECSASIGALLCGTSMIAAGDALRQADSAMYLAKAQGGNRFKILVNA